jgi:hypothetical protein
VRQALDDEAHGARRTIDHEAAIGGEREQRNPYRDEHAADEIDEPRAGVAAPIGGTGEPQADESPSRRGEDCAQHDGPEYAVVHDELGGRLKHDLHRTKARAPISAGGAA